VIVFLALTMSATAAIAQDAAILSATSRAARPGVNRPAVPPATEKTPIHFLSRSAGAESSGSGLFSTSLVLFGLIATAGVVSFVAKRRPVSGSRSLPTNVLQILGRQSVGAGQSVILMRLGERVLLASSSPDGLRTLTEIDDPSEVAKLTADCIAAQPQPLISLRRGASPRPRAAAPAPLHVVDSENDGRPVPLRSQSTGPNSVGSEFLNRARQELDHA
jgi:flagellar biogenesis protein FliO